VENVLPSFSIKKFKKENKQRRKARGCPRKSYALWAKKIALLYTQKYRKARRKKVYNMGVCYE